MKAIEAREKALEINTNEINSQYADVIQHIETYVNKGEYQMCYYKSMKKDVQDKLIEDGYIVVQENNMNESFTRISW